MRRKGRRKNRKMGKSFCLRNELNQGWAGILRYCQILTAYVSLFLSLADPSTHPLHNCPPNSNQLTNKTGKLPSLLPQDRTLLSSRTQQKGLPWCFEASIHDCSVMNSFVKIGVARWSHSVSPAKILAEEKVSWESLCFLVS